MALPNALAYSENALEYLEKAPKKIGGQLKRKIDALRSDPFPSGCKKLVGVTDGVDCVYRVRSGDYRVLYVVKEKINQINILDIDDRKSVYR